MTFHIYESVDELVMAYANYFVFQAKKCIDERGHFNVVLSGGSSPKRIYELLASPHFRHEIEWGQVYFFFGDERHVPADDPRNNGLLAEKAIFHPLNIAEDHIFKINTLLPPIESAKQYMEDIKLHFQENPIHFDLILLGLGDDAHTASLFPSTPVLSETKPSVKEVYLKKDNTFRITMTAPLINQASEIAFLVFGENKALALRNVINGERKPNDYPAQLIQPENGETHWFLDKVAATELQAS
jgi:6-phosphogluconolactonase